MFNLKIKGPCIKKNGKIPFKGCILELKQITKIMYILFFFLCIFEDN